MKLTSGEINENDGTAEDSLTYGTNNLMRSLKKIFPGFKKKDLEYVSNGLLTEIGKGLENGEEVALIGRDDDDEISIRSLTIGLDNDTDK